ncbi:hypothetical protein GCM10014713_32970 [Streptomyces purpureus]|uniref:Core-binding (CB) domain-containing protein n=2 Tax=Streptomyces purpureus TaxID=1951 RepID=A0A918H4F6_9ACTN|nr:hypothetical protein GCM10014713_32970 [Streptomyces purpureus]
MAPLWERVARPRLPKYERRGRPRKPDPPPASPPGGWLQPALFEVCRDFTGTDPDQHAGPDNPWLAWARHTAHRLGENTVWNYLNRIRPVLIPWSSGYDHLREVTRDDVLVQLDALHGGQRQHTLIVLRSLFRQAKKNGTIFKNPTSRIRVGQREYGILQPLEPEHINTSVAAVTKPADRLVLALAAVHAARSGAIRRLQLDDLDIGNHKLTIDGRIRRLDDLTLHFALEWLKFRRRRWPDTANPHLLINKITALGTGPVSGVTLSEPFRGQAATLEQLRVDRQLEEALVHGPDPLHLAEVFGLDEKTAIRYANSARALLDQAAEQQLR